MKFRCVLRIFLLLAISMQVSAEDDADAPPIADTLPEHLAYLYQLRPDDHAQYQLYAEKRRWDAGETLKVCFYGGNAVVRALIAGVAVEWQTYANITFDFGVAGVWRNCQDSSAGFSQVRVGFGSKGYWSAIGTDSRDLLNVYQPSMNLQEFDFRFSPYQPDSKGHLYTTNTVVESAPAAYRGTILHEFGHALGLLHEHQNPKLGCQAEIRWQEPNSVYDYYARPPNRWDRLTVDRNLGPISKTDPDYVSGDPDRESIMIYAQPAEIFIHGKDSPCFVSPANVLSSGDKSLIATLYPKGAPAISDTAFKTSNGLSGLAMAPPSGLLQSNDRLARIKADLQSDVTSTRREARRQLALALETGESSDLTELLSQAAEGKNYREQLGILVAIEKAESTPALSAAQLSSVKFDLKTIRLSDKDATLFDAAVKATKKLGIK